VQVGGGKVTEARDIDKLRASLEKVAGTSGRSLARVPSGKRPIVGDGGAASADQKKALLYNLMGRIQPLHAPPLLHERHGNHKVHEALKHLVWVHIGTMAPEIPGNA